MEEHYQILAYIDDLEEARRLVQESNLSSKLIKMIDSVRGDLVELKAILASEKDYQRLVVTCIINSYMIYSWAGGKNYAQRLSHSTVL